MTQADVDFAVFLATTTPARAKRDRWVEAIRVTRQRMYDQETERLRVLIGNNERKAS